MRPILLFYQQKDKLH